MKKTVKIAIGAGITGITGISIVAILKRRKLAKQAFDAEFDDFDDEIVKNDEETNAPADDKPEFTKYTGIPVNRVSDMLNAVTHKCAGRQYYIKADDFEEIRKSLGVYQIFIRDNYEIIQFSNERNARGEMITFRIKEDYCVSNDGFFLIDGKWKYLSVNEVLDDYSRCAQCRERLFVTDECLIK